MCRPQSEGGRRCPHDHGAPRATRRRTAALDADHRAELDAGFSAEQSSNLGQARRDWAGAQDLISRARIREGIEARIPTLEARATESEARIRKLAQAGDDDSDESLRIQTEAMHARAAVMNARSELRAFDAFHESSLVRRAEIEEHMWGAQEQERQSRTLGQAARFSAEERARIGGKADAAQARATERQTQLAAWDAKHRGTYEVSGDARVEQRRQIEDRLGTLRRHYDELQLKATSVGLGGNAGGLQAKAAEQLALIAGDEATLRRFDAANKKAAAAKRRERAAADQSKITSAPSMQLTPEGTVPL